MIGTTNICLYVALKPALKPAYIGLAPMAIFPAVVVGVKPSCNLESTPPCYYVMINAPMTCLTLNRIFKKI